MNPRHRAARLRWTVLLAALLCAVSACSPSKADTAQSQGSPRGSSQQSSQTGSSSAPAPQKYVALGDSYSAAPLVPVTDVANGCFRSSGNYPTLAAQKLGADLEDRTCSGARIVHLTTSEFADVPAQLPAVTQATTLVTIGIGGNDQGVFAQLTTTCPRLRASDPTGAPCRARSNASGTDSFLKALKRTRADLTTALRQVHQQAPQAKVLVVGYPQIVAADHVCSKIPLARGDFAYAARINLALNDALRSAAEDTGSTYVDVYAASKGHDICAADPWINGSVTDQQKALAYHPFAVEQQAVADLVVAAAS